MGKNTVSVTCVKSVIWFNFGAQIICFDFAGPMCSAITLVKSNYPEADVITSTTSIADNPIYKRNTGTFEVLV